MSNLKTNQISVDETKMNGVSQIVNSKSIIKLFLSNEEDINAQNEVKLILIQCGWTALYRTIVAGNSKATSYLLEIGADPNIQCNVKYN